MFLFVWPLTLLILLSFLKRLLIRKIPDIFELKCLFGMVPLVRSEKLYTYFNVDHNVIVPWQRTLSHYRGHKVYDGDRVLR